MTTFLNGFLVNLVTYIPYHENNDELNVNGSKRSVKFLKFKLKHFFLFLQLRKHFNQATSLPPTKAKKKLA